jgi:hypothetical protein
MPFAATKRKSTIGLANANVSQSLSNVALGTATLLLLLLAQAINGQSPPQTCPAASEIGPCVCQVKKNGLDILCEATDVFHINRAMTALKPKSPIIFYLKLRHNNLPKLQGFIFLALDIRHLTIHNSSLAVIEETSLSSLGRISLLLPQAAALFLLPIERFRQKRSQIIGFGVRSFPGSNKDII